MLNHCFQSPRIIDSKELLPVNAGREFLRCTVRGKDTQIFEKKANIFSKSEYHEERLSLFPFKNDSPSMHFAYYFLS